MATRHNEAHIVSMLAHRANETSQKEVAAMLGVTPQYLCDILKRRRPITAAIAEKVGFRLVERFEPVEGFNGKLS